jgi:hypothetical protein
MAQEIETVDLTKQSSSLLKLSDKDVVIAISTGGIGLLIKKLWDAITAPSTSSPVEQLEALRKLIRDSKEAGVKKITAKISQPAFKQFKASIHDAKIDVVQEFQDACVFTIEFSQKATKHHRPGGSSSTDKVSSR